MQKEERNFLLQTKALSKHLITNPAYHPKLTSKSYQQCFSINKYQRHNPLAGSDPGVNKQVSSEPFCNNDDSKHLVHFLSPGLEGIKVESTDTNIKAFSPETHTHTCEKLPT